MGSLMHFYAGDSRRIGASFNAKQYAELRDSAVALAEADFSLHLSPIDVDLFSEAACSLSGIETMTLSNSLVERVGGDGEQCSADIVSSKWVEMVASLPEERAEQLAAEWAEAMAREYSQEPEAPSPESIQSVRELIRLCQLAVRIKVAVVYTWSL